MCRPAWRTPLRWMSPSVARSRRVHTLTVGPGDVRRNRPDVREQRPSLVGRQSVQDRLNQGLQGLGLVGSGLVELRSLGTQLLGGRALVVGSVDGRLDGVFSRVPYPLLLLVGQRLEALAAQA